MKSSRILVLAIAAAICGAVVLSNSFAQDRPARQARSTTVAVCNVFNVLKNCQETKDRLADAATLDASLNAELQKRAKQINLIRAEMEGLNPDSEEYERRMEEVERLNLEAEAWHKLKSAKVIRQQFKANADLYKKLQQATQQIATENGIDIVLLQNEFEMPNQPSPQILSGRIRERIVLYHNNQVDITDSVLMRLNEMYKISGEEQ